jgi:hypothetical protein
MLQPIAASPSIGVLGTWQAPLVTILVVAGAMALGAWSGARRRETAQSEDSALASMTSATLGLIAFVLAFSFGMASSRHDARKQLVLADANAIGTAHLRASLLADESAAVARSLIVEYLDRLVAAATDPARVEAEVAELDVLQAKLWNLGTSAAKDQPTAVGVGLFVQALNDVFDTTTMRLQVGARDRIPTSVWVALYVLIGLGMWLVGFQAGVRGFGWSVAPTIVTVAFALVALLISDLDRPQDGFLRVLQQPMLDLQRSLHGQGH